MKPEDKNTYWKYAQYGSVALGLAVTGAAYMYIPGSLLL